MWAIVDTVCRAKEAFPLGHAKDAEIAFGRSWSVGARPAALLEPIVLTSSPSTRCLVF